MKDDVELNEVRVGIEDMMARKECSSRKTGLERLWRSQRWRLMRKLDSEVRSVERITTAVMGNLRIRKSQTVRFSSS
jgi:hypothetical protein